MTTIQQQIQDTCVHYQSPFYFKECGCKVNFRDLVKGDDFGWMAKLPCVRNSAWRTTSEVVDCAKKEFPTQEKVEELVSEWNKVWRNNF